MFNGRDLKHLVLGGLLAASGLSAIALTQLPHTFTAGTPIRASEVNANFQALKDRVEALEARAGSGVAGGGGLPAPNGWARVTYSNVSGESTAVDTTPFTADIVRGSYTGHSSVMVGAPGRTVSVSVPGKFTSTSYSYNYPETGARSGSGFIYQYPEPYLSTLPPNCAPTSGAITTALTGRSVSFTATGDLVCKQYNSATQRQEVVKTFTVTIEGRVDAVDGL